LILGTCLLLIAPRFLRPVTVFRQVRTPTGDPVLRPDGRPLLQRDPVGQLKVNWDAYTLNALGLICIGWSATRGVRFIYEKTKRGG